MKSNKINQLFKKLSINKFTILIFIICINFILSFSLTNFKSNKYINKYYHRIKEYITLLDDYYKSNKAINLYYSPKIKSLVERLFDYKYIRKYLNIIYINLNTNLKDREKIDYKEIKNDIFVNNNDCLLKSSYLVKLLNNNKNNVFRFYSNEGFQYINWILKLKDFKEIVIKNLLESEFKEKYKENKYNYNKILDKFILVHKILGAYIRLYSVEKVINNSPIYRGICLYNDDPILNNEDKLVISNVIFSPNPLSFSYDINETYCFSELKKTKPSSNSITTTISKVSVTFEISKTQNCLGNNLDDELKSIIPEEKEYLLKPFTYLKVLDRKIKDERVFIYLECLKDNKKHENSYFMK